jgi:hypothetical protein
MMSKTTPPSLKDYQLSLSWEKQMGMKGSLCFLFLQNGETLKLNSASVLRFYSSEEEWRDQ